MCDADGLGWVGNGGCGKKWSIPPLPTLTVIFLWRFFNVRGRLAVATHTRVTGRHLPTAQCPLSRLLPLKAVARGSSSNNYIKLHATLGPLWSAFGPGLVPAGALFERPPRNRKGVTGRPTCGFVFHLVRQV